MDGCWGPSIVQGWLDEIEAMDKWIALFFSDPLTVSDPLSVEVLGASYARVQPGWNRTAPHALTLADEFVFQALAPATNVAAMAVMDGAFGGTLIARELISPVRSYPTGGAFRVDVGEWVLGIQVPSLG